MSDNSTALNGQAGAEAEAASLLQAEIDRIGDVLASSIDGTFDLVVRTELPDQSVQKLCMMLNFLLDNIRGIIKEREQKNSQLADQIETIRRQQRAIAELSTPILQVWDQVIVLPLIGIIDTSRANDIMEKVLRSIGELSAHHVILDLTGVDTVDTKTADHIMKVVRAAQLLGARCILTGIQPAVAQTLVEVGVELQDFKTLRNLQAGLKACLKEIQEAR